jgi:DNA-directed RNA polymerase specialized sigma24 family protein
MSDVSDMELLRDYDRQGSEEAFAALVHRNVNLVYSAALRHAEIAAHAEEITQAVFIILARKAASLRVDIVEWAARPGKKVTRACPKSSDFVIPGPAEDMVGA